MLISTMNDVPGYKVTSVLGEVFGLTVRSRNVGSNMGAAFKSLKGGELKGLTGVDAPYEPPEQPDLVLDTTGADIDQLAAQLFVVYAAQAPGEGVDYNTVETALHSRCGFQVLSSQSSRPRYDREHLVAQRRNVVSEKANPLQAFTEARQRL